MNLGIAGVILEDQELPKRCGHLEGKRLISMKDRENSCSQICQEEWTQTHSWVWKKQYEKHILSQEQIFIEAPQSREELIWYFPTFPY